MSVSVLTRTALLATVLALPVAAFAQAPAAPANPADTAAPAVQGAGKGDVARESRVEKRISDLHAKLKITPAQESQWNQFAQVMRDNARDMEQTYEQRRDRVQQMNAVDNMQSYAQIAQAHAQDVQKLVPAFQTLYNTFSPEQKQLADQLFRSYAERSAQRGGHHRG
jgi:Spy/CpxP family protein refolding chaperone